MGMESGDTPANAKGKKQLIKKKSSKKSRRGSVDEELVAPTPGSKMSRETLIIKEEDPDAELDMSAEVVNRMMWAKNTNNVEKDKYGYMEEGGD